MINNNWVDWALSHSESVELRLLHGCCPDKRTGCLNWVRRISRNSGYGYIKVAGKKVLVHRVAWLMRHKNLSPSNVIDHLCNNRICCNPDHMEEVPQRENMARINLRGRGWKPSTNMEIR